MFQIHPPMLPSFSVSPEHGAGPDPVGTLKSPFHLTSHLKFRLLTSLLACYDFYVQQCASLSARLFHFQLNFQETRMSHCAQDRVPLCSFTRSPATEETRTTQLEIT
jgi:hypothetical protein